MENELQKNVKRELIEMVADNSLEPSRTISVHKLSARMKSMIVNKDLQQERKKCTFNILELTHMIDGGAQKTASRRKLEEFSHGQMKESNKISEEYLSHKEKYERAIENVPALLKYIHKVYEVMNDSNGSYWDMLVIISSGSLLKDGSPIFVHILMFLPAILGQASAEQRAHWLPRAINGNIIGTYAQTELGHGTFIKGLETTATYDSKTKEFILNSPTLSSSKWWPGGLGRTANYCIVVAQLYIDTKHYGIHSFMVQLRDEETHMPLPGIEVGNIGVNLGLNSVDNGFLRMKNVRIPRTHMLMKHAKVLEDGTYVNAPSTKLIYGPMVFVRVFIVYEMCNYVAKAVTIAVRYSAVRRQSQIKIKEPESQILDFATQQHKLFINIATYYAFKLLADQLRKIYEDVTLHLQKDGLLRLPELHALACCLKAVSTSDTVACVERCRLACGGHGYMISSNLPVTYGMATAACTYEGENTVLLLQTARFLVKTWQTWQVTKNKETLTPTVSYFAMFFESRESFCWENSMEGIARGFEIAATSGIDRCVKCLEKCVQSGMPYEDAWNSTSIQLVAIAEAHCRAVIIRTFHKVAVERAEDLSYELRLVLLQLVELYGVYWTLQKIGDLLLYTSISKQDTDFLHLWYDELLIKIRPNAVGLVDAFDFSDEVLNSTLGAYDGRAYERLMAEALKSPLNAEPVNRTFHTHLKPLMQGKL